MFGVENVDFGAPTAGNNSDSKKYYGGGGGGSYPKRPGGGGGGGSVNPNFRTMADLRKSAPGMPSCATGSCPYS